MSTKATLADTTGMPESNKLEDNTAPLPTTSATEKSEEIVVKSKIASEKTKNDDKKNYFQQFYQWISTTLNTFWQKATQVWTWLSAMIFPAAQAASAKTSTVEKQTESAKTSASEKKTESVKAPIAAPQTTPVEPTTSEKKTESVKAPIAAPQTTPVEPLTSEKKTESVKAPIAEPQTTPVEPLTSEKKAESVKAPIAEPQTTPVISSPVPTPTTSVKSQKSQEDCSSENIEDLLMQEVGSNKSTSNQRSIFAAIPAYAPASNQATANNQASNDTDSDSSSDDEVEESALEISPGLFGS